MRTPCGTLLVLAVAVGCGAGSGPDPWPEVDRGPIEEVIDELTKRVAWPGVVDADGQLSIRSINGFFAGEPTAYWFSGFAPRFTAEVFWFCRQSDSACPLAADGTLDPSRVVGRPVFARIPGEEGYSPYWAVQVVRVPDHYQANDIKSVLGIERAVDDGLVTVEPLLLDHGEDSGPGELLVHCLLVLEPTELERNGADMIGRPGVPSRRIQKLAGWHKQYQVRFFDFLATDGPFAPDPESPGQRRMPAANIYVMFRDCEGGSQVALCDDSSGVFPSVSERGVERDLNGDGDKSDTNNVIAAAPGEPPADPLDRPYSPLWAVNVVGVVPERDPDVALIDTTGDQSVSDITSVQAIREAAAAGLVSEPAPMSEAQAGNSVPGNDGEVFFNCPSQVASP